MGSKLVLTEHASGVVDELFSVLSQARMLDSNDQELDQYVNAVCAKNRRGLIFLYAPFLPEEYQHDDGQCEQEREVPGQHSEVEPDSGDHCSYANRHKRIEYVAPYQVAN